MKIGLIGAPNSGKREVAAALASQFNLVPIIGYVEKLEDEIDLKLGYDADFLPNFLVINERWKRERMAGDDFVTSGTHIESLCYSALWTNDMNETLNGEARHVFRTRSMVAIDMHMMYYLETWPYDHVLYLPGKSDENLDRRLDFSIRDGLAMLQIDHYTLDGENRAEQAIEYIRSKREPTNTTE